MNLPLYLQCLNFYTGYRDVIIVFHWKAEWKPNMSFAEPGMLTAEL
jgi:hypothetical protein